MDQRCGVTLKWPAEELTTVKVHNFSPVWRKFEVVEIVSGTDPGTTEQAVVTREMLFPVRSATGKYVGGLGYVEDPDDHPYTERTIHSYIRLLVPSPLLGAAVLSVGEEGAWRSYREELLRFGPMPPIFPSPTPRDR